MNLKSHLGKFSWAASAKTLPAFYIAVLVFVVLPTLSIEEFGRYSVVYNLFLFITFINKSLVLNPMIRFAAVPDKYKDFIQTGFQLNLLFYIGSAFAIWLLSPILSGMFRISTEEMNFVPMLLIAISIREFGFCVQQIKYKSVNIFVLEAIYFAGSATGLLLLFSIGTLNNAADVLAVNLFCAALASIVALFFGMGGAKLFAKINRSNIAQTIQYGWYTIAIGITGSIVTGADVLLMAGIYTPIEAGVYNAAKQIYRIVSNGFQAIALFAMPFAAKMQSQTNNFELKSLVEKLTGYIFLFMVPILFVNWFLGDWFFNMLQNGKYASSALIFQIMLISAPFEGLYIVLGNILYGMGLAGVLAVISGVTLIVWMLIAIPGVYLFGIEGGTFGIVAAMFTAGIATYIVLAKKLNIRLVDVFNRTISNVFNVFKKISQ